MIEEGCGWRLEEVSHEMLISGFAVGVDRNLCEVGSRSFPKELPPINMTTAKLFTEYSGVELN
jgi:hypothetical protein